MRDDGAGAPGGGCILAANAVSMRGQGSVRMIMQYLFNGLRQRDQTRLFADISRPLTDLREPFLCTNRTTLHLFCALHLARPFVHCNTDTFLQIPRCKS